MNGEVDMKKAMVIGSISTDFVVTTQTIPQEGETVIGESFQTHFGGKGANQAIALSRSGVSVFMLGAVGDDQYGKQLIQNLQDNQIDTQAVQVNDAIESGSAHIQIQSGDNRIIVVPGANDTVSIAQIQANQNLINQMDMVVLQNELPLGTIEYLIDFCFEQQIPTIYNPAPVKKINQAYLDKVTYLTPNEHEIVQLFDEENYMEVLKRYPNKLIVTLGSKGAAFFDGEQIVTVPAQTVKDVVDTTGAGDTFNGYLANGILAGYSLAESLALGNAASALAIQTAGAQAGIPYEEEVANKR